MDTRKYQRALAAARAGKPAPAKSAPRPGKALPPVEFGPPEPAQRAELALLHPSVAVHAERAFAEVSRYPRALTSGKQESLRKFIGELTGGGAELVEHAVRVMRGSVEVDSLGNRLAAPPSYKDQAEARNWLADRYWGKAKEHVVVESTPEESRLPAADLTDDELAALARITTRLTARSEDTPSEPITH